MSRCKHVASLLALLVATLASQAAPAPRPNIVLIFADDLGYGDLGCFGSKLIRTPNLDRMAQEGTRFTRFYAQVVCGPSRAALMTGCYPIRVAEPGNRKNQHTVPHPKETTIAEVLKSAGYATGIIGKWHQCEPDKQSPGGWNPSTMPNGQGFDYFYGTPLFNGATVRVQDAKFRSPIMRNQEIVVPALESWDHITQDYTKEAIQFIRAHREQPFFLYLAHNMPHIPLGASEQFKGKSKAGPFGDAVEEIDWSCGEIFKALKELGLDERTLVIFTSDNGPWIETTHGMKPGGQPFIPREHSGHADPLRGYKMLTWEGGMRVPCVVRWPGHVPAGRANDEVAMTLDFLPTFGGLAGAKQPDVKLDGRDVAPLFLGEAGAKSPHEAIYYYAYTHLQAVQSGQWKLVLPRPEFPKWTGWSGRFFGSGVEATELYDMTADMSEQHDVAAQHPDVVKKLMVLVEAARDDLGDYNRIGKGARFYDEGPKRPDVNSWKPKPAGLAGDARRL